MNECCGRKRRNRKKSPHLVPDLIWGKLFGARLSDANGARPQLLGRPPFPPQPPPAAGKREGPSPLFVYQRNRLFGDNWRRWHHLGLVVHVTRVDLEDF